MVASIRLEDAQGRQVRLAEVVKTLQDPRIDFRIRVVARLQGFDRGQGLDRLLRLRILLGVGQR